MKAIHQKQEYFLNRCFDKNRLKALISWSLLNFGETATIDLIENLKNLGFRYATQAGISLSIDDLKIPSNKFDLILQAELDIQSAQSEYYKGNITTVEKFQQIIDTWHKTSETLRHYVIQHFSSTDPVYMMAFSGARGNISQVRQLVGMRGLMADPQGQIIDFPIQSNFREGLTLTEYVISCYGARKGLVDTALRTANSGYLTRRLVDVAHHVIVCQLDCGTFRGIFLTAMKHQNKTLLSLQTRLLGRVLAEDIKTKNRKIALRNQDISFSLATKLSEIKKIILVRSPLTCEAKNAICQLCYGWSLAHGNLVSLGEAVGVLAAQSIGEPGTQLTMRTFHTGGVFAGDVMDEIRSPFAGKIDFSRTLQGIMIRTSHGKIAFLTRIEGEFRIKNQELSNENVFIYTLRPLSLLYVRHGEILSKNQLIAEFSLTSTQFNQRIQSKQNLNSEIEGQVYFENVLLGMHLTQDGNFTKVARNLGSLWVLSSKIYQSVIASTLFAKKGDLVDLNSIITESVFLSPYSGFLDNLKKKTDPIYSAKKTIIESQEHIKIKEDSRHFWLKYNILKGFLKKIRYKKLGYFFQNQGASFQSKNEQFFIKNLFVNKHKKKLSEFSWFISKYKTKNNGFIYADNLLFDEHDNYGHFFYITENEYKTNLVKIALKHKNWDEKPAFIQNNQYHLFFTFYKKNLQGKKAFFDFQANPCLNICFIFEQQGSFFQGIQELKKTNYGFKLNLNETEKLRSIKQIIPKTKPSLLLRINNFSALYLKNPGKLPNRANYFKLMTKSYLQEYYYNSNTPFIKLNKNNLEKSKNQNLLLTGISKNTFFYPSLIESKNSKQNQCNTKDQIKIEFLSKPGWLYFPINQTKILKLHQLLVLSGKKIIDDICFDQNPTYIEIQSIKKWQQKTLKYLIKNYHQMGKKFLNSKTLSFSNNLTKTTKYLKQYCAIKIELNNVVELEKQFFYQNAKFRYASQNFQFNSALSLSTPLDNKSNDIVKKNSKNNFLKKKTRAYYKQPEFCLLIRKGVEFSVLPKKLYKNKLTQINLASLDPLDKTDSLFNKQIQTNLLCLKAVNLLINYHFFQHQTLKEKSIYLLEIIIQIVIPKNFPFKIAKYYIGMQKNLNPKKGLSLYSSIQDKSQKLNFTILDRFLELSFLRVLDFSFFMSQSDEKNKLIQEEPLLKNRGFNKLFQNKASKINAIKKVTYNKIFAFSKNLVNKNFPFCSINFFSPYSGEVVTIQTNQVGKQSCLLLTNLDIVSLQLPKKTISAKIDKNGVGNFLRLGDEIGQNYCVNQSGQIIQIEEGKITLRKAQPILFSSRGLFHVDHNDFVEQNSPLLTLYYQRLKTGDIVQGIPKIEEFFEARQTKEGEDLAENLHQKLHQLFDVYKEKFTSQEAARKSLKKLQQILVNEVQNVYQSQGVTIADKHLEIIIRQMTSKVRILEGGQTGLLRGELIDLEWIEIVNKGVETQKAEYEPIILGITKAALETQGFLSAASFQETTRILSRAAIEKKTDFLRGLKENVILGHIIPAGTGFSLAFEEKSK